MADHLETRTTSYDDLCQAQIKERGVQKEIVAAATECRPEETFFKWMILVAMDLTSGFIFLDIFSKDRTYPTWKKATSHFGKWNIKARLMVSDRAKALIKFESRLGVLSCP